MGFYSPKLVLNISLRLLLVLLWEWSCVQLVDMHSQVIAAPWKSLQQFNQLPCVIPALKKAVLLFIIYISNIVICCTSQSSYLLMLLKLRAFWRRRPSGIPEDDVAAHLVHALTTLLNKLQSVSAEVEIENDRLCRAVTERRRLVESLKNEAIENKMKLMQVMNCLMYIFHICGAI